MGAEFHKKLQESFLDIARKHPERCIVVSANGTIDEVANRIWQAIAPKLELL